MSCAQDPIFYRISLEQPPRDAIIGGSGGNMVLVESGTYRGVYAWTHRGRDVWRFADGSWHRIPRPGGPVAGLAVAGQDVFAAVYDGRSPPNSHIMRFQGGGWHPVFDASGYVITSFYGVGNRIFAGAQHRAHLESHTILGFDAPPHPAVLDRLTLPPALAAGDISNALAGAVERSGTIYLATGRNGVFRLNATATAFVDPAAPAIPPGDIVVTSGMISTGADVIVVGRVSDRGVIRVIRAGSAAFDPLFAPALGRHQFFTGGMGVWQRHTGSEWIPALLLLGIWTHNHNVNGYREIALDSTGSLTGFLRIPGDADPANAIFSSVQSTARYRANIGTRAVQAIMQVPFNMLLNGNAPPPGWQPPIFASTSRDGLWVYNHRNDQWNADDNRYNWLP